MGRDRNERGRYNDRIDPDTVIDVFAARDDAARPVTATDVVEELGIARRTAHNKLNALVERGTLDTRKIGARGRVWWIPEREDVDTFDAEDLRGDATTTLADESVDTGARADAVDDATDGPADPPADAHGADATAEEDALDAVDRVAESWEGTDDQLEARKAAARAVLDYAREHGTVSKQEAKENIRPEYPVEGQNARTWYRKTIRPVLNEAAEYDQSARAYRLTDAEGDA